MRIPRQAFGVPLHPLLVHFPIAFWLAVPALDVAALYAGPEPWWMLALAATVIGVVVGVLAIGFGLLEYLEPTVVGVDMRLAARHGVRTTLAWCIFAGKLFLVTGLPPAASSTILVCLLLDLLACVLLVQGIYFGTRQVYAQLERQ